VPTTVVRLSGTTFLILEPGDNLSMPLMFVLLRCRLIASLFSGSLLTGMDFLETLPLLLPTIPVIPVPSSLLRAGLPVVEGTEVLLSLIELPIREDLLELIRLAELPICGFGVVRTVAFLVLIMLPIRDDLLELIRLLELPTCGCVLRTLGVLVLIELPIREDLLELIRLPELDDVCLPVPELTVVVLLLLRELVLRADVLRRVGLLDGLRVPEVVPGLVTGRLTVTLLG